ncbi:unnamed protein product [Leptosia nina]|uniref:Uncharacterized protein n=1 Tax=Leptosia nina TaxID=320188 RepID=A0AAV1J8T0_9NEOP
MPGAKRRYRDRAHSAALTVSYFADHGGPRREWPRDATRRLQRSPLPPTRPRLVPRARIPQLSPSLRNLRRIPFIAARDSITAQRTEASD